MSFFKKASTAKKRFKLTIYGPPGCGKTLFALTFPKPAYIDMEGGADWYIGREIIPGQATDFMYAKTRSSNDVIKGLEALEKDLEKNPGMIETVIIDPVTVLWNAMQDAYLERVKRKKGPDAELRFQDWRHIKGPYGKLMTLLQNMPVNFVLIGREGSEYDMKKGELVQTGTKIQSEKDTPYLGDIYARLYTETSQKTGEVRYMTEFEKDRTNAFGLGAKVENLSYQKLLAAVQSQGVDPNEGDDVRGENYEDTVRKDSTLYDEHVNADTMVKDERIVKLYKELDWAPGKVKAIIEKNKCKDVGEIGKILAAEVRKMREKDE